MKRVFSLLTMVVLCFMLAIPAFAAEPQEAVSVTKVADSLLDGNYVTSLDGFEAFDATNIQEIEPEKMPMNYIPDLISPEVSPLSVQVYPVIFVPEENAGYILNDCGRYKQLSGTAQSELFNLSTSATTTYINEIQSTMQQYTNLTGNTCYFIGWQLTCKIQMIATRPEYIELTPTTSCISGTDPIKETIPPNYNTCTYTISGIFEPTKALTEYQWYGFKGQFAFTQADGSLGAIDVMTGFSINCSFSRRQL
ncbi:hypothetical protein [uncultured Flavonifractor sp.]|uniref:hypothetical protein n=1 Tax=uncultured Flavonifractor sp. TaxID=1193534 RepID=UPI00262C6CFF|nr:hypothetical protein [uncultured Flavonifractor sp.]